MTKTLNDSLRTFETVEANLLKAERLLKKIESAIPTGICFGSDPDHEIRCAKFDEIYRTLPKLDGWKPTISLMGLNEIAQARFDAQELDMIECLISVEQQIEEPGKLLRDYRIRFDRQRAKLVHQCLESKIEIIDTELERLSRKYLRDEDPKLRSLPPGDLVVIKSAVSEIGTLLGHSSRKLARWGDLCRHLHFGDLHDLKDIVRLDWPSVRPGIALALVGDNDPLPIEVDELSTLVASKPRGKVVTKLKWKQLTDDEFERLIFNLISSEDGYENPKWLTKTNATDRGRDLSVERVHSDPLSGVRRERIIIQCKHWLKKSVGHKEVSILRDQMKLWEPPKIDVHIIATTGRFSADAVDLIERQNLSDSALRIEMWPDSKLESILAQRPDLIAEFGLR